MSPELSRGLGKIVGTHFVFPAERERIIGAALNANTMDDLPQDVRDLLTEIERRGLPAKPPDSDRST